MSRPDTEALGMSAKLSRLEDRLQGVVRPIGSFLVDAFHYAGLFVIGAATVWAAGATFLDLLQRKPFASIEDLLLLFIFLEVGAMVGIYFKTNHMPVRFLIYVAITAVTRHLIAIINHAQGLGWELLVTAATLLTLALALLAIRYGSYRFPAGPARPTSFKTDLDGPD
ncbi:MAG: phosphate-starvation-inducible PsiE family protein [Hyphomicrobiaceae bacterium]|nr:phosphate-starvation-inducible PsiE family protein [Hyphomicrobiaceae bacterium]